MGVCGFMGFLVRGVDGHGGAITGYSDTHKVSYKALRGSAS
ncbi:hypothetical protein HMPREF0198_1082 [Cardiobacterium hominis ATCC 15826]|uniref:Uncharacterized protein n=1 Tax=Cardiobacterium hominis (strain ATCC 15826 / DSM 8339 / NCTC 10426 / 6573) TaxID=638300 RepID=C8N9A4_CARH6|nr:hypothetical protein HMPREF0198_1082 [Cardiobacterium hominis ATCC 15826]